MDTRIFLEQILIQDFLKYMDQPIPFYGPVKSTYAILNYGNGSSYNKCHLAEVDINGTTKPAVLKKKRCPNILIIVLFISVI